MGSLFHKNKIRSSLRKGRRTKGDPAMGPEKKVPRQHKSLQREQGGGRSLRGHFHRKTEL
jgi:hypothetical protein